MAEISLQIKKATSKDLKMIAEMAEEIWTEHYIPLIGEAQVRYMLEKFQSKDILAEQMSTGGYVYFIAYIGSIPCGYEGIKWESETRAVFLSKLYVKSEFRRRGVSRALLDVACKEYADYESIYLTVNKNNKYSINAYRRLGFNITKSVIGDIGNGYVMDDYVMTLKRDGFAAPLRII